MKKLYYLIILTVILGLVLTGCLLSNVGQVPTSEQSGVAYLTKGPASLSVISDENTMITKIYNKAGGGSVEVPTSQNAVRAWEPDPYATNYPSEPPEATDSTWDSGMLLKWFQINGEGADWIWETHLANDPAVVYDPTDDLYDADAAINGRVVLFETTFDILGDPSSATLRIAADNGYEAWVNSGTHYLSPTVSGTGWENSALHEADLASSGWQSYGTFTIAGSELINGSNTLYVLAGNEYFARDDIDFPNTPTPASQYNPGAVIFHLYIDYEVVIEEVPGIEVVKECPPAAFAYVGDILTYNYTVSNTGDGALLDVSLVDDQLGLITLISLTDEDGDTFLDDLAEGDSPVEATSNACIVEICYKETAFGGETAGLGKAWWFYFETSKGATQTIWAGQHYNAGTVTVSECTITIELADGWYLQDDDESVKIQGYNCLNIPSKRQPAGRFETYKGDETEVEVDCYGCYIIQLDVQHCGEFEF